MTPLLNLDELASVLGRSPSTIRRDLRRNPDAVPPRLLLPGTRLLRWRQSDVERWLNLLRDADGALPKQDSLFGRGARRGLRGSFHRTEAVKGYRH